MKGLDLGLEATSMLFNLHLRWKHGYKNQIIQILSNWKTQTEYSTMPNGVDSGYTHSITKMKGFARRTLSHNSG